MVSFELFNSLPLSDRMYISCFHFSDQHSNAVFKVLDVLEKFADISNRLFEELRSRYLDQRVFHCEHHFDVQRHFKESLDVKGVDEVFFKTEFVELVSEARGIAEVQT